jgi:hypothetical protein
MRATIWSSRLIMFATGCKRLQHQDFWEPSRAARSKIWNKTQDFHEFRTGTHKVNAATCPPKRFSLELIPAYRPSYPRRRSTARSSRRRDIAAFRLGNCQHCRRRRRCGPTFRVANKTNAIGRSSRASLLKICGGRHNQCSHHGARESLCRTGH